MISVVLPVYNAQETLEESISSIVSQTYRDFELIIINNASTDKSNAVIQAWMDRDKRIRKVDEPRKGLVFAFNRGLEEVRGDWIARMDADDIAFPDRFQKQINYMFNNPDVDLLGTQIKMFGAKEKITNFPLTHRGIELDLCFRNCIAHPSLMIRRERIGNFRYEAGYNISDDYIQWIRWLNKYKFANLAEPLVQYRVHESQSTRSGSDMVKTTERKVMKEALAHWSVYLSEEQVRIHHEFTRHINFKTKNDFTQEVKLLGQLFKKTKEHSNVESLSILRSHWNRLLNSSGISSNRKLWAHLTSPISDMPLALWRKSRRDRVKQILGGGGRGE